MTDPTEERTHVESLPGMLAPGVVLLGRYRIEAKLGVGGYGLVLRAHDEVTATPVAIKVLRTDLDLDAENIARFEREGRAIRQLRSEHVVTVHDVGRLPDGAPYLVMELLEGADLGSIEEPIPVARAAAIVMDACDAIAEAHARGIVHRDLKPTNLFLTRGADGRELVKVLDFGISKTSAVGEDLNLTQTASLLGTPAYMSPEQMRSPRDVDGATDIWALGAVLYELVEGRLPFEADSFAEQVVMVATQPHAPMTRVPQLAVVIDRCLAKDPRQRYARMAELADALAPFATVTPKASMTTVVASVEPPASRRSGRRFAILGGAVLVGAAAAIAFAFSFSTKHDAPPPAQIDKPVIIPTPEPTLQPPPPPVVVPESPPPPPVETPHEVAKPPPPVQSPPPKKVTVPPKPKPKCDLWRSKDGHC